MSFPDIINLYANFTSRLRPQIRPTSFATASVFLHRAPNDAQTKHGYELFPQNMPIEKSVTAVPHHELIFTQKSHSVTIATGFRLMFSTPPCYNISTLTLEAGKYSVQKDRFEDGGATRVLVLRRKTGEKFGLEGLTADPHRLLRDTAATKGQKLENALDKIPREQLDWMKYVTIRIENVNACGKEQWGEEKVKKTLSTIPKVTEKGVITAKKRSLEEAQNPTVEGLNKAANPGEITSTTIRKNMAATANDSTASPDPRAVKDQDTAPITSLTEIVRKLSISDTSRLTTAKPEKSPITMEPETSSTTPNDSPKSQSQPLPVTPAELEQRPNVEAFIPLIKSRYEELKQLSIEAGKKDTAIDWDASQLKLHLNKLCEGSYDFCDESSVGPELKAEVEPGWEMV